MTIQIFLESFCNKEKCDKTNEKINKFYDEHVEEFNHIKQLISSDNFKEKIFNNFDSILRKLMELNNTYIIDRMLDGDELLFENGYASFMSECVSFAQHSLMSDLYKKVDDKNLRRLCDEIRMNDFKCSVNQLYCELFIDCILN